MPGEQYVCTVCGFNMVGYHPANCPFCGASQEKFLTSEECSARHRVESTPVTARVTRLNSVPPLGIEHAAYRLETAGQTYWIDCPSSFDRRLHPTDVMMFTHHHFLGASNQYRELWGAEVRLHELDAAHELCRRFTFDTTFRDNFSTDGIEAFPPRRPYARFHLVFLRRLPVYLRLRAVSRGPNGLQPLRAAGGDHRRRPAAAGDLEERQAQPAWVCGVNYVLAYATWWEQFQQVPIYSGY